MKLVSWWDLMINSNCILSKRISSLQADTEDYVMQGCGKLWREAERGVLKLQAIEAAIEMGLSRVEAGAQGEHKIQRGYVPSLTYSSHYFPDSSMRSTVSNFLQRESMQIDYTLEALTMEAPFKANPASATVDMPM